MSEPHRSLSAYRSAEQESEFEPQAQQEIQDVADTPQMKHAGVYPEDRRQEIRQGKKPIKAGTERKILKLDPKNHYYLRFEESVVLDAEGTPTKAASVGLRIFLRNPHGGDTVTRPERLATFYTGDAFLRHVQDDPKGWFTLVLRAAKNYQDEQETIIELSARVRELRATLAKETMKPANASLVKREEKYIAIDNKLSRMRAQRNKYKSQQKDLQAEIAELKNRVKDLETEKSQVDPVERRYTGFYESEEEDPVELPPLRPRAPAPSPAVVESRHTTPGTNASMSTSTKKRATKPFQFKGSDEDKKLFDNWKFMVNHWFRLDSHLYTTEEAVGYVASCTGEDAFSAIDLEEVF
ncbi:hypothetical protein P152DRAFT_100948, partial [Eremomyces bilateralis CBS 781.70]